MKFGVVVIPVSDVDRAKDFYQKFGWRLDADYDGGKKLPRDPVHADGLGCAIIFGKERHPCRARIMVIKLLL